MVVGEAFCGAGRSSGEVRRARFRVMDGALEARVLVWEGGGVREGRQNQARGWMLAGDDPHEIRIHANNEKKQ